MVMKEHISWRETQDKQAFVSIIHRNLESEENQKAEMGAVSWPAAEEALETGVAHAEEHIFLNIKLIN